MVMKIKSFWKIAIGLILSLFAGSAASAQAAGEQKTQVVRETVQDKKDVAWKASPGAEAWQVAPSDVAWKASPGAEAWQVAPSDVAWQASPGAEAWKVPPTEGKGLFGRVYMPAKGERVIVLPSNIYGADIPVIESKEADQVKYQNSSVVIMSDGMSGYLRIPIVVSDEERLLKEYNDAR